MLYLIKKIKKIIQGGLHKDTLFCTLLLNGVNDISE